MINACIWKGTSSFSSGSSSTGRSNSDSPNSYSNSIHYRDSNASNLLLNLEVVERDLNSRSQTLPINDNNIKPEVSNFYQIQQIRHNHFNHNTLVNPSHLQSQHLINHNLTNHLTNQHLINQNFTNHLTNQHPQFPNHQFDEILAVAAAANLSSQSSANNSPSVISSSNSSSNQTNQANSNGLNSSSTNNENLRSNDNQNNNESNLMNVDLSANEQLDNNTNQQTTSSQIYTPQQNNMLSNFQYHQQNFTSSPNLPQQQNLHSRHLHTGNSHSLTQQQNQQLQLANHHPNVTNHTLVNSNALICTHQSNQQQLQSDSLASSLQHRLHIQQPTLQQQLQSLQTQSQDSDVSTLQLKQLEAFAEKFKNRRIKLGITQSDVGRDLGTMRIEGVNSLSQSTICRFESLTLSQNNMLALKPALSAWLSKAEIMAKEKSLIATDPSNASAINSNGLGSLSMIGGILCNADKKRKRTSIGAEEKRKLEEFFNDNPKPTGESIVKIAAKLDLGKNVVRVWFCNQRQKSRRMKK